MEEILHFGEVEMKELGVKYAGHRTRMVTSLKALAAKYEKGKDRFPKGFNLCLYTSDLQIWMPPDATLWNYHW